MGLGGVICMDDDLMLKSCGRHFCCNYLGHLFNSRGDGESHHDCSGGDLFCWCICGDSLLALNS